VSITGAGLTCELSDLTVDAHPGQAANVRGDVLGIGNAGRYVYFVATGALTDSALNGRCPEPANSESCENLYVADTVTGTTTSIASLSEHDAPDWDARGGVDLGEVTARVSSNGRYLAFMSRRSLSGYDNRDVSNGERDQEVYLYDRTDGSLGCASCDPSGQRPTGVFDAGEFPGLLVDRPRIWIGQRLAGSIPGWTRVDVSHALYQSRYLSDSGRLFFNSPSPLVPADANGQEDVYEYEPSGVGSCAAAVGCVGLMSSGSSNEESAFLDASETGDDSFFLTAAALSSSDVDQAFDVYDARACTSSSPCLPAAAGPSPECSTSATCQPDLAAQPGIFGPAPSASIGSSGNVRPATSAVAKPKPKPLTRAQKYAKAVKACKKLAKKRRAACLKKAKRQFGPKHSGKKSAKKTRGSKS
jgi:hypothetical protein